ncbi:prepilin-type N-terminal cleavage/methylation domain-containing protein [Silanimonas sp.]|uniref:prepilin-type N-terminal cleavage/methylation domain-containing protein n=1 Tax=Silanimonas sp. TaxID=1929290 RepID=UPI001BC5EE92|nr:prepilin-type N-terminal cleavage/methylation domain-containing protein [Silanimonas sp.]MBS3896309.1 prepilin-type N-terminal cleavage/methylation domain-containing protein [Silanimonas sp.]
MSAHRALPPLPAIPPALGRPRGFTLLELLIVLVLLATLGAIALPRLTEGGFRSSAFAQQVAAALRYGQRLAVASGCEIQVQVHTSGSGGYSVRRRAGGSDSACGPAGQPFTVPIPSPTGGDFSAEASGGVQVTQGLTVVFDAQGLPAGGGGTAIVSGRSIVVDGETGFVH